MAMKTYYLLNIAEISVLLSLFDQQYSYNCIFGRAESTPEEFERAGISLQRKGFLRKTGQESVLDPIIHYLVNAVLKSTYVIRTREKDLIIFLCEKLCICFLKDERTLGSYKMLPVPQFENIIQEEIGGEFAEREIELVSMQTQYPEYFSNLSEAAERISQLK